MWYDKYYQIYNKDYHSVDSRIKTNLKEEINSIKQKNEFIATIALIAHNEGKRIAACIWSLCENKCEYPFEIIVIDNNSTDNTTSVLNEIGAEWYEERRKGPGFARNCGLDHAKGKYYLCIDSDSMYPPLYIKTYIETLMKPKVVCCYGLWSFIPDKKHSKIQLMIYEYIRDAYLKIQNIKRPELNVRGMTFAFHTCLGKKLRFRTDIIRGEDGSLALAMKQYGKLVFLTGKKTRIVTDNNTMNSDGTMTQSLVSRVKKAFKNGFSILKSNKEYKDEESNIIKKE